MSKLTKANKPRLHSEGLLDHALFYCALGWEVFPLHFPLKDGDCSCFNPDCHAIGKHPMTRNGFRDASSNPKQIEIWWKRWPNANIGIKTGKTSELVVIDIDSPKGGDLSFEILEDGLAGLQYLVSYTGAGKHIYLKTDPRKALSSRVAVMPGIDVRAKGGYVVAPPSMHQTKKKYVWDSDLHPELVDPDSISPDLSQLLSAKQKTPQKKGELSIPEGDRNNSLARVAGLLKRGGLNQKAIFAALNQVNLDSCNPPLATTEVAKISESISRYKTPESAVYEAIDLDFAKHGKASGVIATKDGYYLADENGAFEKQLSNFTMRLDLAVRYEKKWGETDFYREFSIFSNGNKTTSVEIPSASLLDLNRFSSVMAGVGPYIWLGSSSELKRLMLVLLRDEAKLKTVRKVLCLGFNQESGKWVFPNSLICSKEGYRDNTEILPIPLDRSQGSKETLLLAPATKDKVTGVANLIHSNLGPAGLLAFGWCTALPFLANLQKIVDPPQFPHLFLYGKSKSGKSILGDWLLKLFGQQAAFDIGNTSPAFMQRLMSYYSCLPVLLNEYQNTHHSKSLETLLLNAYDRSGIAKAERDSSQVRSLPVRAALILAGEHLPDRPSLLNRCVTVRLTAAARIDEVKPQIEKELPSFSAVGSRLILNSMQKQEQSEFKQRMERIKSLLLRSCKDQRLSFNYAIVLAAISPYVAEVHKDELLSFVKDELKGLVQDQDENSYVTEFVRDLDQIRSAATDDNRLRKVISNGMVVNTRESHLNIPMLYPLWEEALRKRGRVPNLSQRDIRKYLLEEKIWVKEGRKHIGDRFLRVVTLVHANMPEDIRGFWQTPGSNTRN